MHSMRKKRKETPLAAHDSKDLKSAKSLSVVLSRRAKRQRRKLAMMALEVYNATLHEGSAKWSLLTAGPGHAFICGSNCFYHLNFDATTTSATTEAETCLFFAEFDHPALYDGTLTKPPVCTRVVNASAAGHLPGLCTNANCCPDTKVLHPIVVDYHGVEDLCTPRVHRERERLAAIALDAYNTTRTLKWSYAKSEAGSAFVCGTKCFYHFNFYACAPTDSRPSLFFAEFDYPALYDRECTAAPKCTLVLNGSEAALEMTANAPCCRSEKVRHPSNGGLGCNNGELCIPISVRNLEEFALSEGASHLFSNGSCVDTRKRKHGEDSRKSEDIVKGNVIRRAGYGDQIERDRLANIALNIYNAGQQVSKWTFVKSAAGHAFYNYGRANCKFFYHLNFYACDGPDAGNSLFFAEFADAHPPMCIRIRKCSEDPSDVEKNKNCCRYSEVLHPCNEKYIGSAGEKQDFCKALSPHIGIFAAPRKPLLVYRQRY